MRCLGLPLIMTPHYEARPSFSANFNFRDSVLHVYFSFEQTPQSQTLLLFVSYSLRVLRHKNRLGYFFFSKYLFLLGSAIEKWWDIPRTLGWIEMACEGRLVFGAFDCYEKKISIKWIITLKTRLKSPCLSGSDGARIALLACHI